MRIKLKNFKQHKAHEIELPENGLILFKGKSGAGKSTILDALYEAVTGEADDVSPWSGEKPLEVMVDQIVGKTVVRQRGPVSLRVGSSPDSLEFSDDKAQAEIARALGMGTKEFLASSYIRQKGEGSLLTLPPAEQLRFIQSLAFGDQDPEEYRKRITNLISTRQSNTSMTESIIRTEKEQLDRLVAKAASLPPVPPVPPACTKEEDALVGTRSAQADRKKQLQIEYAKLNASLKNPGYALLVQYESKKEMLLTQHRDITAKLSEISAEIGRITERRNSLPAAGDTTKCDQKLLFLDWKGSVESFVAHLKAKYPAFDGRVSASAFLEGELAELEKKLLDLTNETTVLKEKISVAQASKQFHKCPECSTKLVMDGGTLVRADGAREMEEIQREIDDLREKIKANGVEIVVLNADIRVRTADLSTARSLKTNAKTDPAPEWTSIEQVRDYRNAAKDAEANLLSASTELSVAQRTEAVMARDAERALKTISDLDASFAEAKSSLCPEAEVMAEIEEIGTEIEKIDAILEQIRIIGEKFDEYKYLLMKRDTAFQAHLAAETDIEEAKKRLEHDEAILASQRAEWAAAVRLKELSDSAAVGATEAIIDTINEHARQHISKMFPDGGTSVKILSGYKTKKGDERAKLSLEIIHKNQHVGKNVRAISGGEQDRIILAFQLAMSDMYQSPILMIDEGFTGVDLEETLEACLSVLKPISEQKLILMVQHGAPEGAFDQVIKF